MLLVIDTSGDTSVIGLSDRQGRTWEAPSASDRRHGRELVPAIRDLLRVAGREVNDLEVVGVGVGPGSYTGLRIGLTAAKVLAYASRASLVAVDSLHAVAESASDDALHVAAVADAQRGDVYAADFSRENAGAPLVAERPSRIDSLQNWSAQLKPGTLVVGPGVASAKILGAISSNVHVADLNQPALRPDRMIALVERLWEAGHRADLWSLEPNYLRRSAAEDQWDARVRV